MGRQANLRVQVLGVLAVAVDGRAVPPRELASRKGRTLLKLLLARRGEVVPADVLVEALWAGRPPADPDANLATLVSRLRAVLGPEVIAGDRHGWRFVAGPRVELDLEEATRLPGEADARLPAEPALALAAAERALALLGRGPFLADEPDADWALPARREAERLAARAEEQDRAEDDDEDAIRRRLELFDRETEPLLDFYDGKGLLVSVDADGDVDEVTGRIAAALDGRDDQGAA